MNMMIILIHFISYFAGKKSSSFTYISSDEQHECTSAGVEVPLNEKPCIFFLLQDSRVCQ